MQDTVDYPTRLDVDYPESPSRVLALLGVLFVLKAVLLIPHLIILYVLGIVSLVAIWIGYLAVLITGSYPAGLYGFVLGVQRWGYRTSGWLYGFTDSYPPFSLGAAEDYGVRFEVEQPESSSRILALLGVLFFPKLILLIPHLIILTALGFVTLVVVYIAYWAVAHYRRLPQGPVRLRGRDSAVGDQDRLLVHRLHRPLPAILAEIGRTRPIKCVPASICAGTRTA